MKQSKFPFFVWLVALPFFVIHVWLMSKNLPSQIASAWDSNGQPTAWSATSQTIDILSFVGLGLGMSAFIIGLCFGIRWLPASKLNVPNKAFWHKPANRPIALSHMFYHSFWLGTLAFAFVAATHYFIVISHRVEDMNFSRWGMNIAAGLFMAGVIAWCFTLVRFFLNIEKQKQIQRSSA